MTSLLFLVSTAIGMTIPVLIYSLFGSSLVLTAGLISVVALLCGLCLSIERARTIQAGERSGGIE